jgi:hypothetical protein
VLEASVSPIAGREDICEVRMLLPVATFAGHHWCPFDFSMNSIVENPSPNRCLGDLLGCM